MRLSEEKRQAVYDAIHQPVMDQRVIVQRRRRRITDVGQIKQFDQIDNEMFYLDVEIFKRVLRALNAQE